MAAPGGSVETLGAQPLPRVLEPAASDVAQAALRRHVDRNPNPDPDPNPNPNSNQALTRLLRSLAKSPYSLHFLVRQTLEVSAFGRCSARLLREQGL